MFFSGCLVALSSVVFGRVLVVLPLLCFAFIAVHIQATDGHGHVTLVPQSVEKKTAGGNSIGR